MHFCIFHVQQSLECRMTHTSEGRCSRRRLPSALQAHSSHFAQTRPSLCWAAEQTPAGAVYLCSVCNLLESVTLLKLQATNGMAVQIML